MIVMSPAIYYFFSPNEQREGGGEGIVARLFTLYYFVFPCSADQEKDWLPCKVVFSGWQAIGCM